MRLRNSVRALVCGVFVVAWVGLAMGGDFELVRATTDGGGAMHCTGGDFELSATIGQPDAGVFSGGDYVLTGGFWFSVAPGDGDEDGLVSLLDFDSFEPCLLGPAGGLDTGCASYDVNGSGHVDLRDYAAFQTAFTGGL